MRELVGDCHPLAMIAYSDRRPRWHNERRQAKVNVRPRSSPRSTKRTLRTSHVVMHIPGRPRETASITTEASTSTLWIERENAAVEVALLFTLSLLVLGHLTCACAVSIWLKKNSLASRHHLFSCTWCLRVFRVLQGCFGHSRCCLNSRTTTTW